MGLFVLGLALQLLPMIFMVGMAYAGDQDPFDSLIKQRLLEYEEMIGAFEHKTFRNKEELIEAWDIILGNMPRIGNYISDQSSAWQRYLDLSLRVARAWRAKKIALLGIDPTEEEMKSLHPNDIAAGLLPNDTIGDRNDLINAQFRPEILLAGGRNRQSVTLENIHPRP